jgi:hypothetical protein
VRKERQRSQPNPASPNGVGGPTCHRHLGSCAESTTPPTPPPLVHHHPRPKRHGSLLPLRPSNGRTFLEATNSREAALGALVDSVLKGCLFFLFLAPASAVSPAVCRDFVVVHRRQAVTYSDRTWYDALAFFNPLFLRSHSHLLEELGRHNCKRERYHQIMLPNRYKIVPVLPLQNKRD